MKLQIKFTIFLILKINLSVQQEQVCTLPDGLSQSSCIRLHRCDYFQNVIKEYNGRPPNDVVQMIKNHLCGVDGKYVCCPSDDVLSTNNTTVEPQISTENAMSNRNKNYEPIKANLTEIKNHQNFNLINANSCGSYISSFLLGSGGVNVGNLIILISLNSIIKNMLFEDLFHSPWTVLLGYRSQLDDLINWDCGASLITERFVLTAAHCVNPNLEFARVGEHTISTELDCNKYNRCADPVQDILIEKKIKHPKYNRKNKVNDIALLKLATPADTTKNNVKTICLPTDEQDSFDVIKDNNYFNIYGWGTIGDGNRNSDVLQKIRVPLIDHQFCFDKYIYYLVLIHETHICAGGYENVNACAGDSGGGFITPLFHNNLAKNSTKMMLYGVILGGVKCDNESSIALPGVYTNIDYYLHWILDNLSQ